MRLIKITGGLGNQMFIYAFYLQMKKRFPNIRIDLTDMMHYNIHNGYEMHRVFGLPQTEFCMNQTLKKMIEFLFFKTILERKQHGSLLPYMKRYLWPFIYFKGLFQSEKYFKDAKEEVRRAFTFDLSQANTRSIQMREQIDNDEHAVSLHIRRGDYLQSRNWKVMGAVCQLPYYCNALKEIKSLVEMPHYYVFSDDLDWVKENLDIPDAIFIDWNKGKDSWQDMMLMSRCRHHIICNSTFSWWGAWLNPRTDKKVIAPNLWFQNKVNSDICPESWIRVSVN